MINTSNCCIYIHYIELWTV